MRTIAALLLSCGLLFGLAGGAAADAINPDTGEMAVYYAGAIPAGAISFDGDLSDWAPMPSFYTWTLATAPRKSDDLKSAEHSLDDFDFVAYIGWIPDENMIAIAIDVTDDVGSYTREELGWTWVEDNAQFNFDPDHDHLPWRPTPEEDSEEGQQNFFTPDEGLFDVFVEGGAKTSVDIGLEWAYTEPYLHMGWAKGAGGSYTLEFALALFDHLDRAGPDESVRCMLEPGKTIGFGMFIGDADTEDDRVGAAWHFGDPGGGDAEVLGNLVLMSLEDTGWGEVAVEPTTWGQIKSLLK
jgi:hypothetical protein